MFDRIGKGLYWDRLWRLVDGCTQCSPGCAHCWSAKESYRMAFNPNPKIHQPVAHLTTMFGPGWMGQIRLRESNFDLPPRTRKPQSWLILNDLFHEQVNDNFVRSAWENMVMSPRHIFLLLTKRIKGMADFFKNRTIPTNIWLGVTVCNQEEADEKIPLLLQIPEAVRWVSIEPMLGPIDLKYPSFNGADSLESLEGINWVVLGGETGPGARPMHPEWARSVHEQCQNAGVPFFFKQVGEWVPAYKNERKDDSGNPIMFRIGKKLSGRLLDGLEYNELPEVNK